MHPTLAHVLDNLGPQPRRFRREEWPDLTIPEPSWIGDDDMAVIFKDQRFLYAEGEVVWGTFVQANAVLSRPGPSNAPGTLIYSRHAEIDDDPRLLQTFARRLGALKHDESENEDEQRYGEMLYDEMKRAMRWRAPETCTSGLPVYSTSVMVCRKHLPRRVLIRTPVPILRHRDTVATIIVPCWFWPRRFREKWEISADELIGQNTPWVTVTDVAADFILRTAQEQNLRGRWCVRVRFVRSDDGSRESIKLDIDLDYDEQHDRLFRMEGFIVAFDRRQAEELRGVEIDFVDDGNRKGFVVG
jgi:Fe-S cluster assembly iron-binding protein IscA